MKKVLVTAVVTLTTALFLSTGHAGNGKKKDDKRGGKGSRAVISYSIDAIDCAVTISSTKKIRSIVLKDSDGKRLKIWRKLNSKTFSDFGMYSALLTEGRLIVSSGSNGRRGKRSHTEIGDEFRAELAACLDVSVPMCPTVITTAMDLVDESNVDFLVDEANACEIYGPAGSVGVYNGLSDRNGSVVGATVFIDGVTQDYDLSLEEADACQLHHGYCAEYDNRL